MKKRRPMERHICETLVDMLEEMSLEKVKVKELTDRAFIGRSTFYLYYDSVEAVYDQIEEDFFSALEGFGPQEGVSAQQDPDNQQLPSYVGELEEGLLFLRENSDVILTLCGSYGAPEFKDHLKERAAQIIEQRLSGLIERADEDRGVPSYVVEYVATGWFGIVMRWLEDDEDISAHGLAMLFHYLLRGAAVTCNEMDELA